MTRSTATVATLLDRIQAYIDTRDFASAIWWCERLHAAAPTLDNLVRFAHCMIQSGDALRAHSFLQEYQGITTDANLERKRRFLLARACFELNKLQEAEKVLLEHVIGATCASVNPSVLDVDLMPSGAAGFNLLGQICMKQNRRKNALAYFHRCLEVDPGQWSAFKAMCQMGAALSGACSMGDEVPKPGVPIMKMETGIGSLASPNLPSPPASGFLTPQNNRHPAKPLSLDFDDTPLAPKGDLNSITLRKPPLGSIRKAHSRLVRDTPGPRTPRRSERLQFTTAADTAPEPVVRIVIIIISSINIICTIIIILIIALAERCNRTAPERPRRTPRSDKAQRGTNRLATVGADDQSTMLALANAIPIATEAYRQLFLYQSKEAIDLFSALPESQFNTPWVLVHLGRAYFEINKYQKACDVFERARRLNPCGMSGMDIYSTALWQLKQEVKLAFLAQQTLSLTRLSPEPWIALGNCFSLQKEHDVAIKFLQRAIQLDPNRAYAHTLMAHEFIANEDFEKAITGFRNAVRIDDRHYNAWYGLGTIYFRQEKYDLATYHFERAIKIHSRNSVLECYLGMVHHANHNLEKALVHLERSCELEPKNLLPKFQKANVLFSMAQYDSAMEELEQLEDLAPREASVQFLIGKICKKRGDNVGALLHFTSCLDLDPKDHNLVKANIDRLEADEHDSTNEEFSEDDGNEAV